MTKNVAVILEQLHRVMHALAIGVVAVLAVCMLAVTVGSALGWVPWLSLPVAREGGAVDLGPLVQAGAAAMLLALVLVLPASARVLRLELSHRRFVVGMEDIARAYHTAHADDRRGVFRMGAEFDAVRERLAHLRRHPDLGGLEPEVLEIAAQMSVRSRQLAETYADEKVSRARRFLEERQVEVERSREILGRTHHAVRELKRLSEAVDLEEGAVVDQRRRLEDELAELLRAGERPDDRPDRGPGPNVVRMAASGD